MARILIPYATIDGQTARVAEAIAEIVRDRGHDADAVDIKTLGRTIPSQYDAVIIGASIHMGKHDKHVVEFVKKNHEVLVKLPSAFFSVSLAAHGDVHEAEGYVDRFEAESGWRPDTVAMFGGALLYTEYGFIKRHLMKRIAKDKPGDLGLDTSRDYVYTEWDAVRRFAEHFVQSLELKPA